MIFGLLLCATFGAAFLFLIGLELMSVNKALGVVAGEIRKLRLQTHVIRQATPKNWPPRSD